MNRISIICLGVRDMKTSIKFYRDLLGFKTDELSDNPPVIFFNTNGTKFELYPIDDLVKDISPNKKMDIKEGFSGVTLAYNVKNKEDVDKIIALARSAGATILKEPTDVFWGGYHAYFADPDGYCWEVAWGADFKFDENDMLIF